MVKRKITLKVKNARRMVEVLEKLSELNIDLEAEGRPGVVTVVVHGTKEDIRRTVTKLREFTEKLL
jgi:hypothetical protein